MEQSIGRASKMIGANGSTVPRRQELTMVISTLIYRCETWAVQTRHEGRIPATQMRVLRWIEGCQDR